MKSEWKYPSIAEGALRYMAPEDRIVAAAAPDLLYALEMVLPFLQSSETAMKLAKDAIAKASFGK